MKELIEQIMERIEKELSPQMIISTPVYRNHDWETTIEFRKDWVYLGYIKITRLGYDPNRLAFHTSQITYNQNIPMNRFGNFSVHVYTHFDLQNRMQDILSLIEDFKHVKIERTEKKET